MVRLKILSMICIFLQATGLVLVILFFLAKQLPTFAPVLIGIAGFTNIVKFLVPDMTGNFSEVLRSIAAVAGFGIIILACMMI